jgi:hypothetical protein
MLYCIYVLCMKHESSHFLGLFARNFCSQGALCLVCLPQYRPGFVSLRLVNLKRGTLSLFMLECKIHGVFQETRPMTCVLGLEGIALGLLVA